MDKKGENYKDAKKSPKIKPLAVDELEKDEVIEGDEEEENDETALLLAPHRGGLSGKPKKPEKSVHWNDENGNNLFEVLEFHPSDLSDSDDEGSDHCLCVIM